jgi:hypothetical protein
MNSLLSPGIDAIAVLPPFLWSKYNKRPPISQWRQIFIFSEVIPDKDLTNPASPGGRNVQDSGFV